MAIYEILWTYRQRSEINNVFFYIDRQNLDTGHRNLEFERFYNLGRVVQTARTLAQQVTA